MKPKATLEQTQRALARFCASRQPREDPSLDRCSLSTSLGLDDGAPHSIALIRAQVDAFARSLRHKRVNEIIHWLPLTHRALGARLREDVRDFLADSSDPSPGILDRRLEAVAFLRWLRSVPSVASEPALRDLLTFELSTLLAQSPGRRLRIRWFRHRVLAALLPQNATRGAAPLPVGFCVILWWRPSARTRLRRLVFQMPTLARGPR